MAYEREKTLLRPPPCEPYPALERRPASVAKTQYARFDSNDTVLAKRKLAGAEPWAYLNAVWSELAQLRVGLKPDEEVPAELASHLVPQQWQAARRVVALDAA